MYTQCNPNQLVFQGFGKLPVSVDFHGGAITSDAGALLVGQVDRAGAILSQFAACFEDRREQSLVVHSLESMLRQRVLGLCLGYEDINDHEQLRYDPLIQMICRNAAPPRAGERERPLAGKSTLQRAETPGVERYHRISVDENKLSDFFVDVYLDGLRELPREIILDLDATDDRLHGNQEGRFFHGYYDCYCYLPLYIFAGEQLLCAKLRRSNIDPSAGALQEVQRIVARLRERLPGVRIVLRGDSGFCREELMRWCESEGVEYVFGMARNARLQRRLVNAMKKAKGRWAEQGAPVRVYTEFRYRTLDSWSRSRRVIGKAEYLGDKENPRFVVTNIPAGRETPRHLYEQGYCPRGDMENRIKEQQLYLFADRTSSATMQANQLRLWLSSAAYVLMSALRRLALAGTELDRAHCNTIRLKLLKVGARVRRTTRRVVVSIATGYPYRGLFAHAASVLGAG